MQVSRRKFIKLCLAGVATLVTTTTRCGANMRVQGIKINNANTSSPEQVRFWDMYKRNFLRILPNRGTILVDGGGFTPSEGMGHAMFFAAERRDWETFDSLMQGLSNFRKANGLLRWKINSDGSYPPEDENLNCATETEQNVANALLLAYEQTGATRYLEIGQAFLDAVWRNATINFQGRRIILPSDVVNKYWPVFSGGDVLCQSGENGLECEAIQRVVWSPSYLSPEHLRRFVRYDKIHDWNKVADDWYTIANIVLAAAVRAPQRFRESELNPMPDWVNLTPAGENEIGVEDLHPESAFPAEKIMDTLRIPIYAAMDRSPDAHTFLSDFYRALGPYGAIIGEDSVPYPGGYDPGPEIAIAAYGAGLQAIGRDVTAYRQRVRILDDGSFSQSGPDYYRDSICYYAWLLLNDKFPF